MKRITTGLILTVTVGACLPSFAAGPPTSRASTRRGPRAEISSFDLRPEPTPTPALLYQLQFDPAERRAGSGAATYLQAASLLTDAEQRLVEDARDADDAGNVPAFDKAMVALAADKRVGTILGLLDEAGRHEEIGLDVAWRDVGLDAIIPQLNPWRGLTNLLYVRLRQQTRAGDVAGAVGTLRLGYQMARSVGDGGPLLCGLVAVGSAAILDEGLSKLMDRPDAPNLYWAMATAPRPVVSLRRVMDCERRFQVAGLPVLAIARSGEIPSDAWPMNFDMAGGMSPATGPARAPAKLTGEDIAFAKSYIAAHPDVVAYYARRHQPKVADASKVDPEALLATYFIGQFQDGSDEFNKLLGLPYPLLLPRVRDLPAMLRRRGLAAENMYAMVAPSLPMPIETFARRDRTWAALTAVEALRSYAADHGGRLPATLADVSDTPVPDNPVTGKPFEYRVEDGVATLGDHDPLLADRPLEYTVRIRRP
jgi:hypothetical protein